MEQTDMHNIYDKIFKKILTMSAGSVIRLINGLFETDYPTDSTVTYNWTEFHDDRLRRTLADTILTIGGTDSYHMEAQTSVDNEIVFRVFAYIRRGSGPLHVKAGLRQPGNIRLYGSHCKIPGDHRGGA